MSNFGSFVVNVKKANHSYSYDFESLPSHMQIAVIQDGLEAIHARGVNTVAVSAPVDPADPKGKKMALTGKALASAQMEARKLSDEVSANIVAGVIGGRKSDPDKLIESRARQLAIKVELKSPEFRAMLAKSGWKATDEVATEILAERAQARLDADSRIRDLATRQIADEIELYGSAVESVDEAA